MLICKDTVVPCRSCRRLTGQEMASKVEKNKREAFTNIISTKLGDSMVLPDPPVNQPSSDDINDSTSDSRDSDEEESREFVNEDPVNKDGTPIYENSFGNTLINTEVLFPQGGITGVSCKEASDRS